MAEKIIIKIPKRGIKITANGFKEAIQILR